MRPSDPPEDLIPESGTVLSRQILTPRGGFMARPGLKQPPRHAVVVRGGDAPVTEEIPIARSSFLPPPPPSDAEARAVAEKETLRAIPRRSAPPPDLTPAPLAVMPEVAGQSFLPPAPRPVALDSLRPVIESIPPPSDAPVVTGVDDASEPRSRRRQRSRWTIVAAAALGLMLGMVSVATTVSLRSPGTPVAAAPPAVVVVQAPPAAPAEAKTARFSPVPSSRADTAATAPSAGSQRQPEAARPAPPKRSIF